MRKVLFYLLLAVVIILVAGTMHYKMGRTMTAAFEHKEQALDEGAPPDGRE